MPFFHEVRLTEFQADCRRQRKYPLLSIFGPSHKKIFSRNFHQWTQELSAPVVFWCPSKKGGGTGNRVGCLTENLQDCGDRRKPVQN